MDMIPDTRDAREACTFRRRRGGARNRGSCGEGGLGHQEPWHACTTINEECETLNEESEIVGGVGIRTYGRWLSL